MKTIALLCALLAALWRLGERITSDGEHLAHGRFGEVSVYAPADAVERVVLVLSGGEGWSPRMGRLARALAADHALVVGIDTPAFVAALEAGGDDCLYPTGDLENLSHFVQGYRRLPAYFPPLLVGDGPGAALAYELLAQAPAGIFGGALALHFAPRAASRTPLCPGDAGLHTRAGSILHPVRGLSAPWHVVAAPDDAAGLRGFVEDARPAGGLAIRRAPRDGTPGAAADLPAFGAALRGLGTPGPAARPPAVLEDLPLVEVRAASGGERFAVLLSGDGGWAGFDVALAAALAARGVPVVGLDSLRYFWRARNPEGLAADLARVIDLYARRWRRPRALLIGYSQGADVLPFALNRLPSAARAAVDRTVLLAPGAHAAFHFRLGQWLGRWLGSGNDPGTLPELVRLDGARTLCVYGADDDEAVCPAVPAANACGLRLAGGHHFDGDYAGLAALALDPLPPSCVSAR